jgi:hypothetical protein
MNKVDTAKKVFELVENQNASAAAQYLSEDFKVSGPWPEPIGAQQWIAMQDNVLSPAFPDWCWNISDIHQHGEQVHLTYSITGTNTGDLDLSQMGMPNIPATGKSIQLEQDEAMVEFDGDKICSINIKPNPNTGFSGTLAQLGVEMPAPQ